MKKIFGSLLFALLMVACMAATAFAAEPGNIVNYDVTVSGNPGFANYGAVINYDSSVMELKSITQGSLTQNSGGMFVANPANGVVGYAGVTDVTGDGIIFTAVFEIKGDAPYGSHTVTVAMDQLSCSNAAGDIVTLAASGNSEGNANAIVVACEHSMGNWEVTKEATCTEEGEKTRTCTKCNVYTETEAIAKIAHVMGGWTVTKEATCKEAGEQTRSCTKCGGNTETQAIAKFNHVMGDWTVTKNATCTADGEQIRKCVNCDYSETLAIRATGHAMNKLQYDASGHWHVCSVCGAVGSKQAHEFENSGMCRCGYAKPVDSTEDKELDDVPKTGDITPGVTSAAIAFVFAVLLVALACKRRFVK